MPNNIIKSYAEKTGKSISDVESLWNKAEEIAIEKGLEKGSDDFYAMVNGILKKMLKIDEEFAAGVASVGLASGAPEGGAGNGVFADKIGKTQKRSRRKKFKEYLKDK